MTTMMNESNPALYRQLSEPFDNVAGAQTAIDEFYKELYELRIKYELPDIYAIVSCNALDEKCEEKVLVSCARYGDPRLASTLLAHALGFERKKEQEILVELCGDKP